MARRLLFFVAALVLLVAQTALGRVVQIGPVMLDLYLLFVVFLAAHLSPSRTLIAAWALGLARDCFTPAPLGLDAFALLAAAGLLVWAQRRFVLDTDIAAASFAFLASLVHGAVWAAVLRSGPGSTNFGLLMLRVALPVAVYNAAVMPLFARIAGAVHRRVPGEREPLFA